MKKIKITSNQHFLISNRHVDTIFYLPLNVGEILELTSGFCLKLKDIQNNSFLILIAFNKQPYRKLLVQEGKIQTFAFDANDFFVEFLVEVVNE